MAHEVGDKNVQPDENQQDSAEQFHTFAELLSDETAKINPRRTGQSREGSRNQGQGKNILFHKSEARKNL